ncbi:MAG: aspartate 1-decarboxylase [Bdellovibrionales bacterium]
MQIQMLKSKIHRATVTDADLNYEGSVSIDPRFCEAAKLHKFEKVEIYNCNNGARFATYVIHGNENEICLNGAAARHVHKGDKVIICSYARLDESEAIKHSARLVLMGDDNIINEVTDAAVSGD